MNRAIWVLIAATTFVGLTGCRSTSAWRSGKRAERAGDYAVAFHRYCQAAGNNSGSGSIRKALVRTRAPAAAFWYGKGLAAMETDRHGDAWKYFMYTLVVQPDHPHAARMVRHLEYSHRDETTVLRRRWDDRDPNALTTRDPQWEGMLSGRDPSDTERPADRNQPDAANRDSPVQDNSPPAPPSALKATSAPSRKAETNGAKVLSRSALAESSDEKFLFVSTLSCRDDRFPQRIDTIDRIAVKLRGTTNEHEADVQIYINNKRFQRKKRLKSGQRMIVVGSTGKSYELVVLSVLPTNETVRFGLRRAR